MRVSRRHAVTRRRHAVTQPVLRDAATRLLRIATLRAAEAADSTVAAAVAASMVEAAVAPTVAVDAGNFQLNLRNKAALQPMQGRSYFAGNGYTA